MGVESDPVSGDERKTQNISTVAVRVVQKAGEGRAEMTHTLFLILAPSNVISARVLSDAPHPSRLSVDNMYAQLSLTLTIISPHALVRHYLGVLSQGAIYVFLIMIIKAKTLTEVGY